MLGTAMKMANGVGQLQGIVEKFHAPCPSYGLVLILWNWWGSSRQYCNDVPRGQRRSR